VAWPKQTFWPPHKMFDFRRITLFCSEKRLSKHKMIIFSKNLGGYDPFDPPGYAYGGGAPKHILLLSRVKIFGLPIFWLRYCCVWLVYPTFP